jgi:hypothetical protein
MEAIASARKGPFAIQCEGENVLNATVQPKLSGRIRPLLAGVFEPKNNSISTQFAQQGRL